MRRALALALLVLAAPAGAQHTDAPALGPNPVAATPAEARLDGYAQRQRLEAASPIAEVPFRSVGPTVMGGRVADLEGKPGDPSTFYVAYASGGLWRTDNAGASFEPLFDTQASMTIGGIAVDWRGGGEPTVWVGTGESNSSRSSYAGTGVYKSADGGATWTHAGLAGTQHIGRVVVSPEDPNTVWVASIGPLYSDDRSASGVFVTRDGGASWQHTLAPAEAETGAIDLVLDPATPGQLYAATWTRARRAWDFREGGPGSAIWRSDDAGATWQRMTVEGSGFPTGADVGRIGLDVHASGVLYATVDNQARRPPEPDDDEPMLTREVVASMSRETFLELSEDAVNQFLDDNNFPYSYTAVSVLEMIREGTLEPVALVEYLEDANRELFDTPVIGAEVYRSTDGGVTWTRTHEDYLDDLVYSYGYYFGQVRVAPDDPDRLYLLGVPLVASSDGGATWARADAPSVHVDHHALWLDPTRPGFLLSGNDGGVNLSWDAGATWTEAVSPPVGQFYTVQVDDAEPYNVYGGLQDNGVWRGSSRTDPARDWRAEGAAPYERLFGGDGMQVAVDPRDGTVITGLQFGNYARLPADGGRAQRITPRHDLGERPLRFNWQTPIALSRHLPDVLYFGSNKLHRSLDQGDSWTQTSEDLTGGGLPGNVPYGTLTTISESPRAFGLLAVGTDDGHVWVSEDAGRTWADRSAGLPADLWVSRVELSHHARERLYASLNGYRWDHFDALVYASDDLGRTWRRVMRDLPAEPVNVVREDDRNPDVLYVGTDGGLYASLDRGRTSVGFRGQGTDAGAAMPNVPVHDLVIQERERDLVVGTHGRSVWIAPLDHVQAMTAERLRAAVSVFAPDTLRHSERWGTRGYAWSEPSAPEVEIAYTVRAAGDARLRVVSADGAELWAMSDAARPGLNRVTYGLTSAVALSDAHEPGEATGERYLLPGEYVVEVTAGGAVETAPLVVTPAPPPRSRARKKTP